MSQFSKEFAKQRKQNNFSQTQLANALNVKQSTISNWENGKTTPLITDVVKIARILNISATKLVDLIIRDIAYSCDYSA